jgi:hypothetical protein
MLLHISGDTADIAYFNLCQHLPVATKKGYAMDTLLIVILLLVLLGGGGGLYWGMGAGWGIGPIGLILAVIVVALLLNGRRGRSL